MVVLQALRLEVGAVRPADLRAFVPVEAEPAQALEDGVEGLGDEARLVGVLDAQHEAAAFVTGEEPVEESGAYVADVRDARRAGSEANANGHGSNIRGSGIIPAARPRLYDSREAI